MKPEFRCALNAGCDCKRLLRRAPLLLGILARGFPAVAVDASFALNCGC
jgi:hypothetical protein